MLKIYNPKLAQSWLEDIEDIDWFDDEGDRLVDETNVDEYLADEIEESPYLERKPPPPDQPREDYRSEIPTINEYLTPDATREIVYRDANALLRDAMKEQKPEEAPEVIGFDYTNRHGAYAGWRTVEPHYVFQAYTTGNDILVTWDRDVNDIRAFIVGNIHPNGVRYKGESFYPRDEIMRGAI